MSVNTSNPLAKHFRQPSIYLKLPSRGKFWLPDTIDLPDNGEIPIYPMTAKDEIILRTPDALMNGQGIIDVIQSCCPNIKDAWKMPSIDVDAILIAIRIATYGAQLDVDIECPNCSHQHTIAVDLTVMLDTIRIPDYNSLVSLPDVAIKLHPQLYVGINNANLVKYEEQRILTALSNSDLDEVTKINEYSAHLKKIVDLNLDTLVNCTEHVIPAGGEAVDNPTYIKEFYLNCDSAVVHAVQEQLDKIAQDSGTSPIVNQCPECKKSYSVPMEFDYANFFARKS